MKIRRLCMSLFVLAAGGIHFLLHPNCTHGPEEIATFWSGVLGVLSFPSIQTRIRKWQYRKKSANLAILEEYEH
jgi:hypothetical protein